jgi:hypothetical protein
MVHMQQGQRAMGFVGSVVRDSKPKGAGIGFVTHGERLEGYQEVKKTLLSGG